MESTRVHKKFTADDFLIHAPNLSSFVANVIGVIENQAPTRHITMSVQVLDGKIHADMDRDILKIANVERHKGTGSITLGLVNGFGFNTACAVASTVAHDSHHMIVVGSSDDDMALAVNELVRLGGGQVVVKQTR